MTTYTVHYIDGDHDTFEAAGHIASTEIYTLKDVANDDGKLVDVDLIIRNIFSIRREMEE